MRHDGVEQLYHLAIVPHLGLAGRVIVVGRALRDLLEHLVEEHEHFRIRLDEVLEIRDHGMQRPRARVGLLDHAVEPTRKVRTVRWQPFGDAVGNALFVQALHKR
jgi:hypothetical protein